MREFIVIDYLEKEGLRLNFGRKQMSQKAHLGLKVGLD